MRWNIPTLIQQLVDQGVPPAKAGEVVAYTYPLTRGDTFYRSSRADERLGHSVGVYGLWNALRGDQSPLDGVKVSDDARTIAQFLRLHPKTLDDIVDTSAPPDTPVWKVAQETVRIIQDGGYFQPTAVPEADATDTFAAELADALRPMEGAADYIRSIPLPTFD